MNLIVPVKVGTLPPIVKFGDQTINLNHVTSTLDELPDKFTVYMADGDITFDNYEAEVVAAFFTSISGDYGPEIEAARLRWLEQNAAHRSQDGDEPGEPVEYDDETP